MDFSLTPEQERMRGEFHRFFEKEMKEAPADWIGGKVDDPFLSDENWRFHCKVARKLGEKGWLLMTLPEEYGGLNTSPVVQMIFEEVAGQHRAPGVDIFGVKMIGPVIYFMGNEEQKERHLKPIARGEIFWCQGWSETDAGSDLAALSTTGVREGNHYIVNGHKVWTTGAHRADWIFLLVRTDPTTERSRGLTFLLADMKTPGISVEPIHLMNGHHSFNEIFLDNVRIPVSNRLGEENRGWEVSKAISNFERSGVVTVSSIQRDLDDLIHYCKEHIHMGDKLINDSQIRHKLAEYAVEIEVARALYYRIASLQEGKELIKSAALSSAAKIFTADLQQRLIFTGCQIMGPFSQVKQGSKWAPCKGAFERDYQLCIGINIAAGTSEILRNIIAWTALGLPRA
jgi:alkylation response protein AidB-like acyl-CoA dehydrogenase